MATSYTRRINLYINGKEVKNDIKSVQTEMRKLVNEQARMTIGSQDYNAHAAKIRHLRGILKQHQQDIAGVQKSWSFKGMADGFNRYFGMVTAAIASFAGAALTIKSAVQAYAEFDDKLADVMKTTGLTKDQVGALNTELSKLDTRTSQENLLDLARVAGKLGITAEEEILGFVRAADKINVALAEDLGGDTEESINQLGKLVDIFKLKDQYGMEDSLLKIGSAINSLGAAGTANEANMVEFAKRVAGIAPSAGISIQQVLGLAATLDELGQTSEVSGTAIGQVVGKMFKDTATYAGIAGIGVKEFTNLLNTDANEAFIRVLQGAKGSGAGFTELAKNLEGLGLDGARSTAVLGVLANNIDKLREKQEFSNQEFEKGTSIIDEFNTKNTSAQADLEKSRKKFAEMQRELGERLAPAYASVISKSSAFIKALGVTVEFLFAHGRQLVVVVSAIAAYTIATKLSAMWQSRFGAATIANVAIQKLQTMAFNAQFAAIALYNSVVALMTGKLKVAAIQFRAFSAALAANPVGIVIGSVVALGMALAMYSKRLTSAEKLQRTLNQINLDAEKAIVEERLQVEALLRVAKDEYRSKKDRIDAINELKKIAPEYYKGISIETINTDAATTATDKYVESLRKKAKAQAAQEKLVEIEKQLLDIENKADLSFWDEANANGLAYAAGLKFIYSKERILRNEDKIRAKQAAELNLQKEKLLEITEKQISTESTNNSPGEGNSGSEDYSSVDSRTPAIKKAMEASFKEEQNLLKQQLFDKKITQQQYNQEMYALELAHLASMRGLYAAHTDEFIDIDGNIVDKKLAWQKEMDGLLSVSEQVASSLSDSERKMFEDVEDEMDKHLENYTKSVEKETQATIDAEIKKKKAREKAKEAAIRNSVEQAAAAVDGAESAAEAGKAVLNTIRGQIKAYLAEAVAAQVAKAVKTVPFPFNIAVAAAAGGAMSLLFNKLIPEFATGGFTDGDRIYRAGEEGKEWIAPNWILTNPITGPVIQQLETFRQRPNTISQSAIQATVSSPAGASTSNVPATQVQQPVIVTTQQPSDPELKALLSKLSAQLDKPIRANINKYGRGGIDEAITDINTFKTKVNKK